MSDSGSGYSLSRDSEFSKNLTIVSLTRGEGPKGFSLVLSFKYSLSLICLPGTYGSSVLRFGLKNLCLLFFVVIALYYYKRLYAKR